MGYKFNPLAFSGFSQSGSGGGGGGFDPDTSPVQFLNAFIEMRDDAADWWSGSNTKIQNGNAMTDSTLVIGTHDLLTGGDVKKNLTISTGTQDGGPNGGTGQIDFLTGYVWSGTGSSGDFFITTGGINSGVTGNSGAFNIQSGDNSGTGNTGAWNFRTGNASAGNSGNVVIATGTASGTRGVITLDGTHVAVSNSQIKDVADPTAAQDAATKNYVDNNAGANTALSNLITTSINQDLLPSASGLRNLGSASLYWSSIRVQDQFTNGAMTIHTAPGDAVNIYGNVGGSAAGRLYFRDLDSSNFVGFKGPDVVSSNVVWELPSVDGTSGQFLQTNGTGTLTWASASAPSGTANTAAYFNGSGVLSSTTDFGFNDTTDSLTLGTGTAGGTNALAVGSNSAGTLSASGSPSLVLGAVATGGAITAATIGSVSIGNATGGGIVRSLSSNGCLALGVATSTSSILTSSGSGSLAHGIVNATGALLRATVEGTHAHGSASGASSLIGAQGIGSSAFGNTITGAGSILASGDGSQAFGRTTSTGAISATGVGSHAHGASEAASSSILASGIGAEAWGRANSGTIRATTNGSTAFGATANATSVIETTGNACFAFGNSTASSSRITAGGGNGCFAFGAAEVASGVIEALNNGSMAFGFVGTGSRNVSASGLGAFAGGNPVTDRSTTTGARNAFSYGDGTQVSGQNATAFGLSNTAASFASLVIGRYGNAAGTSASWVSTEPLLLLGNGTSTGATASAFQVDKDGKVLETAAKKNTAVRSVSAATTLSARTDNVLFVDTTTATGNVAVTLPAGEAGLEFYVKDSGANASVNNITFTPDGTDTVETGGDILTDGGSRLLKFFNGQWWVTANVEPVTGGVSQLSNDAVAIDWSTSADGETADTNTGIRLRKVGDDVTLVVYGEGGFTKNGANNVFVSGVIPADYRPLNYVTGNIHAAVNGTKRWIFLIVYPDGSLDFWLDEAETAFANADVITFPYGTGITWVYNQ